MHMILLVMGVTGSGKSTVGRTLAERLGWVYLEGDDFHSAANKHKMHRGIPLTEADRIPWLDAMHAELERQDQAGKNGVLACSALREEYRARLMHGLQVKLVYLRGSRELIASRLRQRVNHFAGESISTTSSRYSKSLLTRWWSTSIRNPPVSSKKFFKRYSEPPSGCLFATPAKP